MNATPADTPVTKPPLVMVAMDVGVMLKVPPVRASATVIVDPTQTVEGPVIGGGVVLTVTIVLMVQPVDVNVNVIGATPADAPVTTPVVLPTVATAVLPLTHVPAPEASDSVVVVPVHKAVLPLIAEGIGLTVATTVAKPVQPELVTL